MLPPSCTTTPRAGSTCAPPGSATGKALDEVRSIRDDIDRRVRALLAELTASSSA
jgi:hypothetical protein